MQHEHGFECRIFERPHVSLRCVACPAAADNAVDPAVRLFYRGCEGVERLLAECGINMVEETAALLLIALQHFGLEGCRIELVRCGPALGTVEGSELRKW
jgi:hypothetical protein